MNEARTGYLRLEFDIDFLECYLALFDSWRRMVF